MSSKRLYYILVATALAALLTLGARTAFGAMAPHAAQHSANLDIDSATRSYMAWAKALAELQLRESDDRAEAIRLVEARTAWAEALAELQLRESDDRAEAIRLVDARTAWAEALAELQNSQIDSATRSYMAWAKAMADQQNSGIDSATRSYMAWAKAVEEQQKANAPAVAP